MKKIIAMAAMLLAVVVFAYTYRLQDSGPASASGICSDRKGHHRYLKGRRNAGGRQRGPFDACLHRG